MQTIANIIESLPSREGDFELIKETKFTSGSESDSSSHGLILKKLDDLENKLKSDINEILERIGDLKKGSNNSFRVGRQSIGHNFLNVRFCVRLETLKWK